MRSGQREGYAVHQQDGLLSKAGQVSVCTARMEKAVSPYVFTDL